MYVQPGAFMWGHKMPPVRLMSIAKEKSRWNWHVLEAPTVEHCVKEDALEVQDIRKVAP